MSSFLRAGSKYRVASHGPPSGGSQLSTRLRDESASVKIRESVERKNPLVANQSARKAQMKLAALERDKFRDLHPWQRKQREQATQFIPEYDEDGRTDCRDFFQLRNSVISGNLL